MRTIANDDKPLYRVVVVKHKTKRNPDYVQGNGEPYWILLDDTFENAYGPYNHLGTAKGVLTRETIDHRNGGKLRWGVVGGRIERAEVTWRKVDLGGS